MKTNDKQLRLTHILAIILIVLTVVSTISPVFASANAPIISTVQPSEPKPARATRTSVTVNTRAGRIRTSTSTFSTTYIELNRKIYADIDVVAYALKNTIFNFDISTSSTAIKITTNKNFSSKPKNNQSRLGLPGLLYKNTVKINNVLETTLSFITIGGTYYIDLAELGSLLRFNVISTGGYIDINTVEVALPNQNVRQEELLQASAMYSMLAYEDSIYDKSRGLYYTNPTGSATSPAALRDLLKKDGYVNLRTGNYGNANMNDVSYTIGLKQIGSRQSMIVVVLRGTDGVEWRGNMDVGANLTRHQNFDGAATAMKSIILNYCLENRNVLKTTNFLITGHSRGAAVSNLIATDLTRGVFRPIAKLANVYSYNFAVPNNTRVTYNLPNIFNFNFSDDFITSIPPSFWNFKKSGVNKELELKAIYTASGNEDFKSDLDTVTYLSSTNDRYSAIPMGKANTDKLVGYFKQIAATSSQYYVDLRLKSPIPHFNSAHLFMRDLVSNAMIYMDSLENAKLETLLGDSKRVNTELYIFLKQVPSSYSLLVDFFLKNYNSLKDNHAMSAYYLAVKHNLF